MTHPSSITDRSAALPESAAEPAQQPLIAGVLGISYPTPISDRDGWARVFAEPSQAPAAPRAEMFAGPLGELTRLIAPHVPWDPIAFHLQAITVIGNYLGYGMSIPEGAIARHPNLFLALIGGTGSGKGSSLGWVDWMMTRIDADYMRDRVTTAVGSGQGLLSKITDPVYGLSKSGDRVVVIDGSPDKRVLYIEEELGQLFSKMMTQDTVEKMITKAWDSGVLETLTKHESMKCVQPHVSIIGHITPDELYDRLEKRLVDNGFSNRWLYALIKPTQIRHLEPQPHEVAGAADAADAMKDALQRLVAAGDVEFRMDTSAQQVFNDTAAFMYAHRETGAMEKQIVRWRSQMFKLAVIYAAIDGVATITAEHYLAARATWAYNARSARAFFGGMTGNGNADRFLAMWKQIGYQDVTLSEVSDMFSKNLAAVKRDAMLNQLQRDGVICIQQGPSRGGRPPHHVTYVGGNQPAHLSLATW